MAHKSALGLVLAQMIPVDPKGGQPTYFRSKHSVQTSSRLAKHQACVADGMSGKKFGSRAAVHTAFSEVSKSCARK